MQKYKHKEIIDQLKQKREWSFKEEPKKLQYTMSIHQNNDPDIQTLNPYMKKENHIARHLYKNTDDISSSMLNKGGSNRKQKISLSKETVKKMTEVKLLPTERPYFWEKFTLFVIRKRGNIMTSK